MSRFALPLVVILALLSGCSPLPTRGADTASSLRLGHRTAAVTDDTGALLPTMSQSEGSGSGEATEDDGSDTWLWTGIAAGAVTAAIVVVAVVVAVVAVVVRIRMMHSRMKKL